MNYTVDVQEASLKKNDYGFFEMKINTSMLDLKGSSSTFTPNSVEYSDIKVVTNYDTLWKQAEQNCADDENCAGKVASAEEIYQYYYDKHPVDDDALETTYINWVKLNGEQIS